jgi:uncharacterized protein YecT (DUF1311 family)
LLASVHFAHAQNDPSIDDALKNCDRDQQTMNICAGQRYSVADRALNRAYLDTFGKQPDADARKRLRDAQRAWIAFRDKDCLAQTGPRETSGSIWPLQHYACLEQHSLRRTQDLQQQACGMEGCR